MVYSPTKREAGHGSKAIHIGRVEGDKEDFGQRPREIWLAETGIWLCHAGVVQHS